MLRIGLTGGFACGKSTAANYFAELGVTVIDADVIAREITNKHTAIFAEIVTHFGVEITDKNGELNRAKLRELIFTNTHHRQWLENLLHPIIRKKMQQQATQATSAYCILVIQLIVEFI